MNFILNWIKSLNKILEIWCNKFYLEKSLVIFCKKKLEKCV